MILFVLGAALIVLLAGPHHDETPAFDRDRRRPAIMLVGVVAAAGAGTLSHAWRGPGHSIRYRVQRLDNIPLDVFSCACSPHTRRRDEGNSP